MALRDASLCSWAQRAPWPERCPLAQAAETATRHSMMQVPFEKREPRVAVIGTGGRGTSLLGDLLAADAQIAASATSCLRRPSMPRRWWSRPGKRSLCSYTRGPHDYEALVARNDVDLVLVATPWSWHAPMALAAMNHGKDVAIEVPGVTTIEDCWKIVHASEQTRRHCMILENCCYGYNETLILRMIHAGEFGELLYGEGAYIHDLREELFRTPARACGGAPSTRCATAISIPRTAWDRWRITWASSAATDSRHIVSMSSPERGLDAYAKIISSRAIRAGRSATSAAT